MANATPTPSPTRGPQDPGGEVGGHTSDEEPRRLELSIGDDEVEPDSDWFADLQRNVREKGVTPITFKPVLDHEGYIRANRSHLLASYPKGGKTELMVNILLGWPEDIVLYVSEEGRDTWMDRAYELPDWPGRMKVVYALGWNFKTITDEVAAWTGSVVVIDTIKLLGIEDENDAAKVQAALSPIIRQCRQNKQTLVLIHHDNKAGGRGGRGIAGSHAFVGIVDIFLELDEVQGQPNLRKLSGRGKIRNIEPMLYEKSSDDGLMHSVESGAETVTPYKVLNATGEEWRTTAEVAHMAGFDAGTALKHLKLLAAKNQVLRDPPIDQAAKGREVHWRRRIAFE